MSAVIQFTFDDGSRVIFSAAENGSLLMEEIVPWTDACQTNTVRTAIPFTPDRVAELRDYLQAVWP